VTAWPSLEDLRRQQRDLLADRIVRHRAMVEVLANADRADG
jgi:hypothetical protein